MGLRRESGAVRRMLSDQESSSTSLSSSPSALMPDGGLSPCVIKVLGVGGGGSNAVRIIIIIITFLVAWLKFD